MEPAQKPTQSKDKATGWQLVVNFVPFDSEQDRKKAYETWAELYLKGCARKNRSEKSQSMDYRKAVQSRP